MGRSNRRLGLTALAALIAALGLASIPARAATWHEAARAGGSLTVYAAASLKAAFTAIGTQFDAKNGSTTRFSFGGSDTLATQIVQGAPADVFASANNTQMAVVQSKGLIASAPVVFVRNRLIVIVPKGNPGHVTSLVDLGRPGVRLVLAALGVPAGKYARAAFQVMASDAAFGADFLSRVSKNIVSEETDVKAVVSKLTLGEGDAGVVYVTDVTKEVAPALGTIAIPPVYNQIASYPIGVVKGSQNAALAQAFVSYVLSPAGQAVLAQDGFITASSAPKGRYSPSIRVSGLVGKAVTLSVAALRKLPATTIKATLRSDKGTLGTATYTGVLLWNAVQAAVPLTNTSFKNDMLRLFVLVHATDNYQVTVSMGEISPRFGHQPILLAYAKDGKPIAPNDGAVELIVPGDTLAGRDVKNVDRIVVETPLGNV